MLPSYTKIMLVDTNSRETIIVVATKSAIRCTLFCIINKVISQSCVLNVNIEYVKECTEFPLPIYRFNRIYSLS